MGLLKQNIDYFKTFLKIGFIILTASVFLSILLFQSFSKTNEALIHYYTADQLYQVKYTTDTLMENARLTLIKYSSNADVLKLINYDTLDSLELYQTLRNINAIKQIKAQPEYICFYNQKENSIYYESKDFPASTFPDQVLYELLISDQNPKNLYPILRKAPNYRNLFPGDVQTENIYSMIYTNSPEKNVRNAVVLNNPTENIESSISSIHSDLRNELIIIDSRRTVVLGNDNYAYNSVIEGEPIIQSIIDETPKSGYQIGTIGGTKCLISYIKSDITDWKYIRITPYNNIYDQLRTVLVRTVKITCALLIPALFLGYFISRNIYLIHKNKMNELEQKHQKDKKMGYVARQKALRKIINGSDKNDVETLKLHGIAFDFNKKLNVILLSIDNYADYCKMFTPDTRDLDSFGVINIANEIFMEIGVCETIDIDNGQFIIIINYVDENRISGLLDNLDEFIYKYGKIKVSSIIGECVDSLSDLVPSVLECTDAINYRLFFNGHMRVHISQIRQIQMKNTEIPESEIHNLTNVLMLGKRDELLEKCSGIFSSLNGYSYGSLKVFILKIVMSVQEAINQKGISTDAIKLDDWLEFLKDISQINSLDIIQSRLIDLFDNVQEGIDSVTRLKDMRFHKIYHDIQQAIEQEYNNRNFSPETISEKLNINAEYLKKMYKLNKGVSLSAEINQYRMKKAAELIINTSKPIAEIAQLCGFSNINYFYTFFKHNYGITAAEYRKLNFKEN